MVVTTKVQFVKTQSFALSPTGNATRRQGEERGEGGVRLGYTRLYSLSLSLSLFRPPAPPPRPDAHLGGLGNIPRPNRTVIIRKRDNIPPKPILDKQRSEQLGVIVRRSNLESSQPVLCDRVNPVFDVGLGTEPLLVAGESIGQGHSGRDVGSHDGR